MEPGILTESRLLCLPEIGSMRQYAENPASLESGFPHGIRQEIALRRPFLMPCIVHSNISF